MNVFTATGNLGKDCRVNQTANSTVCGFALAVKSGYGDNAQTLWIDCSIWGKQAEGALPQYLVKGQQVAVSGELGQREHEGNKYLTLRVNSIDLIGKREESQQQGNGQKDYRGHPGSNQQNPTSNSQQNGQQQPPMSEPNFDGMDDDIPFASIGLQYRQLINCI